MSPASRSASTFAAVSSAGSDQSPGIDEKPHLVPGDVADRGAHALVAPEERSAPVVDGPARDLGEQRGRATHLVRDRLVVGLLEVGVRPRVVSHLVARVEEPADDAAPIAGVDLCADREERPTAAVALEPLGDRLRPRRGAIVERERDDPVGDPAACLDEVHRAHSTQRTRGARNVSPMGEMKERMLRGGYYVADDADIQADAARAHDLMERFNATRASEQELRDRLLRELLGEIGEGVVVRPPLWIDYGTHISIGAGTFVNYDCVMLDVAPITDRRRMQLATRVQLLTATHPIDPEPRRLGWEAAEPITIEDNVWLGGGAIVCPGVTIGEDTVVGAGAVVTRDLPAGVVAVGSPARVLREIGPGDAVVVPG